MTYYRKYRPQIISEIIGQEHVKQALLKAYSQGRLSHAYLFCGPKGSGKTSTARILAKMVNCELANNEERTNELTNNVPCNKCGSCKAITDGSNLDLIEIDAASNRGIDDIRDLRERIKLAPTKSVKKVYIIDEVHMLTTEAFNALLKTLEEPPDHVLFILATTEAHKIPETILSRVQRLDFTTASEEELKKALERVIDGEKLKVDSGALNLITKKAEGSFRDGLKILDQLASSGEKITEASIGESFKSAKNEDLNDLIKLLSKKDASQSLEVVQRLQDQGVNIKDFIQELISAFRQILLIKYGASSDKDLEILSALFSTDEIVKAIESLQESLIRAKSAFIISLPLEIAVIEICHDKIVEKVKSAPITADVSKVEEMQKTAEDQEEEKAIEKQGEIQSVSSPKVVHQVISDVSQDLVILKDKWNYVLETIKPYNFSLEALLKQVKLVSCSEGTLILEVPYSFHQRILEAPKSRSLLESVLADVLGKEIQVSCVLGKRPVRVEELANVELAADDEMIKIASEIFNS